MMEAVSFLVEPAFWAAVIAQSAPLIYAALGALFCARAGVVNLGIEGVFIAGAFAAAVAIRHGIGPWEGVVAAVALGMALGAAMAALTGPCGAPHPLAGIAITLLAASLAQSAVRMLAAAPADAMRQQTLAPLMLPLPPETPPAIATLLQQSPLTWLSILLLPAVAYVLARTPLGLAMRACGDNPAAVRAQGRSVHALRGGALVAGSAMMAAGGASLAFAAGGALTLDSVAGRGLVCLALAAAVGWRPFLAVLAVLPFGALAAAQPHLPAIGGRAGTAGVLLMLMCALALAALAVAGRKAGRPRTRSAPADRAS